MAAEAAMAGHCETFDHTADVGLSAWADNPAELLAALAGGLADVICDRSRVRPAEVRTIHVEAPDMEFLAVDFLSRLLYIFDAEHFMQAQATLTVQDRGENGISLTAELAGETYDPSRHEIRTEVKAVTYHQLKVAREGGRWVGRVILDL